MSIRYETYAAVGISTSLLLPHQPFGDDTIPAGQFALVIGSPDQQATAIIGAPADLRWVVTTLVEHIEEMDRLVRAPLNAADFVIDVVNHQGVLCPRCDARFQVLDGKVGELLAVLATHTDAHNNPPF